MGAGIHRRPAKQVRGWWQVVYVYGTTSAVLSRRRMAVWRRQARHATWKE